MGVKHRVKRTFDVEKGVVITAAFDDFIAEKVALGLSKDTLRNYKQSFKQFMVFNDFDETEKTDSIDKNIFFHWIGDMRLEGVRDTSINHYLRDLRAFCYWCMEDGRNYITPFKIEMVKIQEEDYKDKMFSDEEIDKLLVKPKARDSYATWRMWAMINWVLATGNRAATMCNVKVGDIDFKSGKIRLTHTKSKKAANAVLTPALKTAITEYIKMWKRDADDDEWLFTNIGEEKLTTNAQRHSFRRYALDREVERYNIHGLRHNFAKEFYLNGGREFELQELLGHANIEMTRHYIKLLIGDIAEGVERVTPLDVRKRATSRTQRVKRTN